MKSEMRSSPPSPREVCPLPGKVFRQQDAAGPEASLLSIAGDDFDRAGEVDDELPAWRVVPVYEVFARLPEHDAFGRDHLRDRAGVGGPRLHADFNVLEVRLSVPVCVDARVFHELPFTLFSRFFYLSISESISRQRTR